MPRFLTKSILLVLLLVECVVADDDCRDDDTAYNDGMIGRKYEFSVFDSLVSKTLGKRRRNQRLQR